MNVSMKKAAEMVKQILSVNLVPFLQGSPGIGKSAVIKEVAKEAKLKVIDLRLSQCEPTDLLGLPVLSGDKAKYKAFDTFPLEKDKVPVGYKGWLLFLDELNSAPRSVQVAAYKIILDRMVGQEKLNNKVYIVAAGNLATDNAVVNSLSTALRSRLVNIECQVSVEEWLDWAVEQKFNPDILAYVSYKGTKGLYSFNPEQNDQTFACPRTWEMMNKIMSKFKPDEKMCEAILGATGIEFSGIIKKINKLPKFEDIFKGTAKVPEDLGTRYFAMYHMCDAEKDKIKTKDQFNALMSYVNQYDKEFQFIWFKRAIKDFPQYSHEPSMMKAIIEFGKWAKSDD